MSESPHNPRDVNFDSPYAAPQSMELAESRVETPRAASWILYSAVVGFIVGVGSRYVRPMISGPVHYESLVAAVLLIVFLAVVVTRFSGAQLRSLFPVSIGLVVVTWGAYFFGWSIVHGRFWDNLASAASMGALVSLVVVSVILFAVRFLSEKGSSRRDADQF